MISNINFSALEALHKSILYNFDEEFMVKKLPTIPKEYQPDPFYRYLGIISPSCRMMHWNSDYEFDSLRYMCHKRVMTRDMWVYLYRAVRKRRNDNGQ